MHHNDFVQVYQPVGLALQMNAAVELLARAAFMHSDHKAHTSLKHDAALKELTPVY